MFIEEYVKWIPLKGNSQVRLVPLDLSGGVDKIWIEKSCNYSSIVCIPNVSKAAEMVVRFLGETNAGTSCT